MAARRRARSGAPEAPAGASSTGLWVARGILLAVLVWTYAPSLRFAPSSLDDEGQLALAAQQTLSQIWDADRYGHFRPVKSSLFWLWSRPGTDWSAVRFALLSVFALSIALVERLATRVGGAPLQGLLVAACWALHPVTPAAVCWLSAVHGVFCLVGLLAYLECAERSIGAARARWWLALALLSLGFALLSQQLAAVGPLLLWLRMRGSPGQRSPTLAYASSGALVVLWLALVASTSSMAANYRSQAQPAWLMTASAARYVWQHALWWLTPAEHFGVLLSDRPEAHLVASGIAWLALVGVCALCWKQRARQPVLVFGVAWFLITIAPFANFVPIGNTPLGMHYLIVPGIGLAIACVRAALMLVERTAHVRPAVARALPWALGAALALHWLPETTRAVAAFGDEEQLFATTVDNHPDQIEPFVNLASAQLERGRYAAAAATLERAARLEPENVGVVRNQFSLLWQTGELQAALALLERHPAIAARPEFQLGRGQALLRLGRHEEAVASLAAAFDSKSLEISAEQRFVGGTQLVLALLQSQRELEAQRVLARMRAEYPERQELRAMEEVLRR